MKYEYECTNCRKQFNDEGDGYYYGNGLEYCTMECLLEGSGITFKEYIDWSSDEIPLYYWTSDL